MNKKEFKAQVTSWETVASYVATFPNGDHDGACDVEVQIGSVTGYTVSQLGLDGGAIYQTREEAQEEADQLNAEADEECGREVVGDGAARVVEIELWFLHTCDDAGGSDDADDTTYDSEAEATEAAEDFAWKRDEAEPSECADDYLVRQLDERAGKPDPSGDWCVYWETALDDAGPRDRYATREQAEAATELANRDLKRHSGGQLLCGFSVRRLVDGEWCGSENDE